MKRKLFAISCLVGLVIGGAAAVVYTVPDHIDAGPALSSSTTTSTTTTTPASAPRPPGHTGY